MLQCGRYEEDGQMSSSPEILLLSIWVSLGIRIFEISTDDSNAKPLRQTTVIEKIINPGEKVIANIFLNNLAGETDLRVVRPGQAGVVRESYVGLKTGTEGCMKFE